jgi:hypothetical protein
MSWDSVPWFVGGGAEHSPEVARLLAYAATGGAEGIVVPGDLKVVPLAVPGGSVTVSSGAALILNRATGGTAQTYVARNPSADTVGIAPTGSAGGRSDLIVAQIEDPFMAGEPWQAPANPKAGPYVFTRVIPNVPAGTTRLQDVPGYTGRSAVTLARVDLPASTGTVTAAMITDLRALARPRQSSETYADLGASRSTLSSTSYTTFPAYRPGVPVPTWATHMRVDVTIAQLSAAGSATGNLTLSVQSSTGTDAITGDEMAYNADASVTSTRFVHLATAYGAISGSRGKTVYPTVKTKKNSGANVSYDTGSQIVYRVTFYERAV